MITITYPFDLTGLLSSNAVQGENHTITSANERPYDFIVPLFAPFFSDRLVVYFGDAAFKRRLLLNEDYLLAMPFNGVSHAAGQIVYGAISIINTRLKGTITLDYQTVGGPWTVRLAKVLEMFGEKLYNPRVIDWSGILNIQSCFPAENHQQDNAYIYGQQVLINAINEFDDIIIANPASRDIHRHPDKKDNPHQITLEILGHQLCTEEDVIAQNGNNKLMTIGAALAMLSGIGGRDLDYAIFSSFIPVISPIPQSDILSSTYFYITSTLVNTDFNESMHHGSDWQLATDITFNNIVQQSLNDTVEKTHWSIFDLLPGNTYYIRVRYKNAIHGNTRWSDPLIFIEPIKSIEKPVVYYPPDQTTVNHPINVIMSNFSCRNGIDNHIFSDWQLASDNDFATIVQESLSDQVNKTQWLLDPSLPTSVYYFRARQVGEISGQSNWSDPINFTCLQQQTITRSYPEIEVDKTLLTNGPVNSKFGSLIAFSADGKFCVVGTNVGITVVYNRIDSAWIEKSRLFVETPSNPSYFSALAISEDGSTIAIGEGSDANINGSYAGAVFIFNLLNDTWTQTEKIIETNGAVDFRFGINICLSGDGLTLVVSSPYVPNLESSFGVVYIFKKENGTWIEKAKLTPPDGSLTQWFGNSLDINNAGTSVIIASSLVGETANKLSGAYYVYELINSVWTLNQKITTGILPETEYIGGFNKLSRNEACLIIAEPYDGLYTDSTTEVTYTGIIYIYYKSVENSWVLNNVLYPSDSTNITEYGMSIAINADATVIAVGAPSYINNNEIACGGVYIYTKTNNWEEKVILTPHDGGIGDGFGYSLALSSNGDSCVIGASNNINVNGEYAGAFYLFEPI